MWLSDGLRENRRTRGESRTMRYRMTGVGTAVASTQWERKDDDKEIARRVLNLLEDRRLLWIDLRWEVPSDCAYSADHTRKELAKHLDNPEISEGLTRDLKALQGLFRDFMTKCDRRPPHHHYYGADEVSVAIGELRTQVGIIVGALAATYDLEVSDELASIVPDADGWFFERFSIEASSS